MCHFERFTLDSHREPHHNPLARLKRLAIETPIRCQEQALMTVPDSEIETQLFVDGEFLPGQGQVESIVNPASGKVIAQVAEASLDQVNTAVAAATRAFSTWSTTTPAHRGRLLLRVADLIDQDAV